MRTPFLFALAMLGALGPAHADGPAPVVVELFTSQGCSSCPPADALLGELARRPDVVALSLHVDYWDYIGWRDPFASPATTARQRAYAHSLGKSMVYTPQMVIDGEVDEVGSDRAGVLRKISAARRDKIAVAFRQDAAGEWRVALPAAARQPTEPASVWLAVFDREHATPVKRGENAGAMLKNYNVVREWRRLGTWNAAPVELPLGPLPGGDGCAVIVQAGETGPVLGAAVMSLAGP